MCNSATGLWSVVNDVRGKHECSSVNQIINLFGDIAFYMSHAFDRAPHPLLSCVNECDLRNRAFFVNWLKSYLHDRQQPYG